ncbi:hypothetical protein LTR85_010182 [Meristemomyces frigidus]|nr:hypothetical protein LTR85_010182 [Meristemomyces frigidus]
MALAQVTITTTALVVDTTDISVAACTGTTSCTPPLATSSELSAYGSGITSVSPGPPQIAATKHADYVDCSSGTGTWERTYESTSFCILSTAASPSPTTILSSTTLYPPKPQSSFASTPTTSITTITEIATTATSWRLSAAEASQKTTSAQPTNFAVMQDCFERQGGLQIDDVIYSGCGAIFQHIISCYESLAPWTDPYDITQNAAFQACVCETSAALPYLTTGVLFQNYTACSNCLYDFAHVSMDDVAKEIERIDNFCCAEFPNAFLFLERLQDWVNKLHVGVQLSKEPLSALLINSLASLFTTTPPLLNVAYGASAAPFSGSLGGVTPSLTTATFTTNGNDALVTS